ncbi:LytTR family DNA-binding domain-containing protein [Larkinella terrae]
MVENSTRTRAEFQEYLARLPVFSPPDFCTSVQEAQKLLRQKPYDLVCLDTHLPDMTGIDQLRSFPKNVPVIVTSDQTDYAVDSFDMDVADYLLKPFTFLRFSRAVNRALSVKRDPEKQTGHSFIFLKKGHAYQRFDYEDIDYVQAYGIYCKIIKHPSVAAVNDTISNLENVLPNQQFLRVHKSYIVNLSKITSYSLRSISVGTHQIPLGAAYRERFQGFLGLLGKKNE